MKRRIAVTLVVTAMNTIPIAASRGNGWRSCGAAISSNSGVAASAVPRYRIRSARYMSPGWPDTPSASALARTYGISDVPRIEASVGTSTQVWRKYQARPINISESA